MCISSTAENVLFVLTAIRSAKSLNNSTAEKSLAKYESVATPNLYDLLLLRTRITGISQQRKKELSYLCSPVKIGTFLPPLNNLEVLELPISNSPTHQLSTQFTECTLYSNT